MSGGDDIKARLAAVANAYVASLPGRITEMEALYRALATHRVQDANAAELYRLAHSMAGSAATFGHERVARLASALEARLRKAAGEDARIDSGLIEELRAHIAGLASEACAIAGVKETPAPGYLSSGADPGTHQDTAHPLVFLADDDESFSHDLALRLQQHGYRARTFSTLQSMKEALAGIRPEVLVMDMIFPEGSGAGFVGDLRRNSACDFPVVFASVDAGQAARLDAVRAGGNAFMTKPVTLARLIDTLDSLARRQPDQPYRMLVIDDSAEEAEYFAALLKHAGMEVDALTSSMDALAQIEHFHPEIILMDIHMPECSGVELVRILRQMDAYLELPIIFLSGEQDTSHQVSALSSGADAFINKLTPAHDMIPLLISLAARYRLLRAIMSNDSLTGLLVHSKIMDALGRELARAQRNHTELSLVMVDIDYFKAINDTHGHPMGDKVIRTLARLMKHRLRQTDYLGRYGGEEFAIIMPDTPTEKARTVMDQLRRDFSAMEFGGDGIAFTVTFSAGIAGTAVAPELSGMVAAADRALYAAKQQGRNRVTIAG